MADKTTSEDAKRALEEAWQYLVDAKQSLAEAAERLPALERKAAAMLQLDLEAVTRRARNLLLFVGGCPDG